MNQRAKGFTLIEMLVVISIIGVLAGMTVGISRLASEKMRRSRVQAELESLVTAIEAYKAKFDVYPPGNTNYLNSNVISTNCGYTAEHQLYCELTGCLLNNNQFQDQFFLDTLNSSQIKALFGVGGFLNANADLKQTKNFLPQLKTNHVAAFVSTNRLPGKPFYMLCVPVKGPSGAKNPWHYNSTSPTNNPGRFDIWADVIIGGKRHIIGNWNQ